MDGKNSAANHIAKCPGQSVELTGQQLVPARALYRSWFPPIDNNTAERTIRQFAIGGKAWLFSDPHQRCNRQRPDLQPGRDRQTQRPRALYVAAPRTRSFAACLIGRRLRSPATVELLAKDALLNPILIFFKKGFWCGY